MKFVKTLLAKMAPAIAAVSMAVPTIVSRKAATVLGAMVALLGLTAVSHAGTSGTEFQIVYDTITDWVNGYLGLAIAISFLIVGLFLGIARQSIFALAVAGACGFGLLIAPTVLDNILTATVTDETFVIDGTAVDVTPVALLAAN